MEWVFIQLLINEDFSKLLGYIFKLKANAHTDFRTYLNMLLKNSQIFYVDQIYYITQKNYIQINLLCD